MLLFFLKNTENVLLFPWYFRSLTTDIFWILLVMFIYQTIAATGEKCIKSDSQSDID